MASGFHHYHIRKRIHQKFQKYPHPNKLKNLFDKLIYCGAILGPLCTVPQLATVWINKNASGISAVTWLAYFIGAMFWMVYGFLHKEKPIIVTNMLFAFLNLMIFIGAVIYH